MAKGGSFEGECGRELSLLWSNGEHKDLSRRNRELADPQHQGGDLTFRKLDIKPLYDSWNVECKTGYSVKRKRKKKMNDDGDQVIHHGVTNWSLLDILDSRQKIPKFVELWDQCRRDADLTHREPVLIFRRNNRTANIVFRRKYFTAMSEFYSDFSFPRIELAMSGEEVLMIIAFSDFKEWVGDRFKLFFVG